LRVWLGIQLACLVLSVWLLARSNRLPARLPGLLITSLCLVGWPPVALDLGMGQLTLPLLSLLAGAQLALGAGRPHLGGLLLGLSLLLKPLAWPWLLVLGRRRQWSAIIATLATVALGLVLLLPYAVAWLPPGGVPFGVYLLALLPALGVLWLSLARSNVAPAG
jgi:hypothetical protein